MQESNVVLIEQTDIVDLEAAHNHTLQTDAEGVAGVFIRVDAAHLKHLGVNHAAAEDLDPALALAERAAFTVAAVALDIHLRRRLGEREVMRTETNNRVLAVQLLCEQLENALQVAHADALIDNQTLDLMEQRRVGCVNGVRTVNTARRNNADRRLALFHRADLHRRGLRAEHNIIRNIEGILRVACRMILRDVQRLEVVVIQLNLRTLSDREAQTEENLLELVEHDVQRMLLADDNVLTRQGNVDSLRLQLLLECSLLDQLLLLVNDGFDLRTNVVDQLTNNRTLLCGNVLHALEQRGQLTLFAEELDAGLVQRARILRGSELLLRGLQNALQLFFHTNSPSLACI